MKTLEILQIQQVFGGKMSQGIENKPQAAFKSETSTKTPNGITATTVSPSYPEGVSVRFTRFDANFIAPSDSLGEDQPLFPGFNDQGGVV